MFLLVSDIHFGKGPRSEEQEKENGLLQLIDTFRAQLDGLILAGDVFDQFIEYRHLVPKGAVRFLAALVELTAAGVPVVYIVGNHDPWHLDYFEQELGVNLLRDKTEFSMAGSRVVVSHGDLLQRGVIARTVQAITRHPVSMALYRTLLPADFGYRLAHFVKKRMESSEIPEVEVVERLRLAGRNLLRDGFDVAVLGHSHLSEQIEFPEGTYANTGSWHHERTFVALQTQRAPQLHTVESQASTESSTAGCVVRRGRWNGTELIWYSNAEIARIQPDTGLPEHNMDTGSAFDVVQRHS